MCQMISDIFRQGRRFHSALESILISEEELSGDTGYSESVEGYMESVRHVLREIRGVRAIESVVQHQSLNYLGLVDCVAMYRWEQCNVQAGQISGYRYKCCQGVN